jgi:hypothetical protein
MSKVIHLPVTDEEWLALKALVPYVGGTIGNQALQAMKAYPPLREAFQTKENSK